MNLKSERSQTQKTLVQVTYMKFLNSQKYEDVKQISVSLGPGVGEGSDSVGRREIFRVNMF